MKTLKDILETIALTILFYALAIVVFIVFCIFYYGYGLIFEPWMYNVCGPWIVEQIRIIFLHPENFCFTLGMLVFIGGPIILVVVITIMNLWGKIKERTYCNRSRCVYLFGMNKDTFFCERCCHRKKK